MSKIADQDYLLNQQYRDASNLNARIQLHMRFSQNSYGWHPWVFDQLKAPPQARVLELGCGPGRLWSENAARIPPGWEITLSDFSPGMLAEAQGNLAGAGRRLAFERVDVQAIPFADASFDVLIANHMLYHVPDRPRALAEIRRVLRPGGRFYATTIGATHLREIAELVQRFDIQYVFGADNRAAESFTLENGAEQLARFFEQVELRRLEDGLIVTEAEPLIAYILSGRVEAALEDDRVAEFAAFVRRELAEHGAISITKDSGLFEAT
jgi:ubiquinone/menaquinone biosynthesis C-methylase UbiE